MSKEDWLNKLTQKKDDIQESEAVPVDRKMALEEFVQICRNKRNTMLEYHLLLNHLENLRRTGKQPAEQDMENMRLISDKVYAANKEFVEGLDGLDGTECWEGMRKMMDGVDKKEF